MRMLWFLRGNDQINSKLYNFNIVVSTNFAGGQAVKKSLVAGGIYLCIASSQWTSAGAIYYVHINNIILKTDLFSGETERIEDYSLVINCNLIMSSGNAGECVLIRIA